MKRLTRSVLAGVCALGVVAGATGLSAARVTDATWADEEYSAGGFHVGVVPAPTLVCEEVDGGVAQYDDVEISWADPPVIPGSTTRAGTLTPQVYTYLETEPMRLVTLVELLRNGGQPPIEEQGEMSYSTPDGDQMVHVERGLFGGGATSRTGYVEVIARYTAPDGTVWTSEPAAYTFRINRGESARCVGEGYPES
ncbi:hypothetical protein [Brevibacterium litoralis]|uniref:hypothetical protein n=1 Tax=Brevibacterium litoralis TaxID=3138935 RepID=UPI0032F07BD1